MLHFAWCFALSAAESLWSTGNQTILCGSCCSQLKKWTASISFLSFPAFSKQLRTLGSMFDPPNAATSPNCLGTWMQSCNNKPSFRWSTNLFGSAISRNRSGISQLLYTLCRFFEKKYYTNRKSILTSIFFFQMTLAQQDQTNLEGKHANLTGSLTEIRQRRFTNQRFWLLFCQTDIKATSWFIHVPTIVLTYRTRWGANWWPNRCTRGQTLASGCPPLSLRTGTSRLSPCRECRLVCRFALGARASRTALMRWKGSTCPLQTKNTKIKGKNKTEIRRKD